MAMKAQSLTGCNLHGVDPLLHVILLVVRMTIEVTILGELIALNLKVRICMLLSIKVVIEMLQRRSQEAQSVHHRVPLCLQEHNLINQLKIHEM